MRITTPGGRSFAQHAERSITAAGDKTDTVTTNGRTYTRTFDAATRDVTTTTPEGRVSVMHTDAQGRLLGEQIPGLAPTTVTYDERGRPITVTEGTGSDARTHTAAYGAAGRLGSLIDPLSRTTTFAYDATGRLTRTTFSDGRELTYGYDPNGNVVSVTPPGRPAHLFGYTADNLTREYVPAGDASAKTTFEYGPDRQLTRIVRADGRSVDLTYDALGRTAAVGLARGDVTFAYSGQTGNLETLTAPGATLSYEYDGFLPRRASLSGAVSGRLDLTYDDDFRVSSTSVDAEPPVLLAYDGDDLLVQAGELSVSRAPQNGLLTGTTLRNVRTSVAYNAFGEPVHEQAQYQADDVFGVDTTSDKLGRIADTAETIDGTTDTYTYSYDPADRLVRVEKNGAPVATYTYDANGNRLTRTDADGTTIATYDALDRLTSYGPTTFSHTPNGEVASEKTGEETTVYRHDELGNLLGATLPDGREIAYVLDGKNRRVGKKVDGTVVQGFLYEHDSVVAELDGSNGVVSRFVYGTRPNAPDYMVREGRTYRILSDDRGSPRLVIDVATGDVAQRLDFDEFGNVLRDTNPGFQPFGFASGLYDRDTKLTHFGAREYDARVGRWTSTDPIGFLGGDTNLYAYSLNDPVNHIDPSGLAWWWLTGRALVAADRSAEIIAGFGDVLSFGGSKAVRDLINENFWHESGLISECSWWYGGGQFVGLIWGLAIQAGASSAKTGVWGAEAEARLARTRQAVALARFEKWGSGAKAAAPAAAPGRGAVPGILNAWAEEEFILETSGGVRTFEDVARVGGAPVAESDPFVPQYVLRYLL